MDVAELFRASTRLAGDAFLLLRRDGSIVAANDAAAAVLDVGSADLAGHRLPELVLSPADAAAYLHLASGSTDPTPGSLKLRDGTAERRVGCSAALYSLAHPELLVLKLRAAGEEDPFVLLGQKLAELNDEVQRRRRLEDHLRIVTDTIPALVSYVGRDLRHSFVNPAYERWFGMPREPILGATVADVVGAETFQQMRGYIDAALRGEHVDFEVQMGSRHGVPRQARASFVPHVGSSGTVEGYVALISDISREKRAAQAARFLSDATATLSSSLENELNLTRVAQTAVPAFASWCAVFLNDDGHEHALREIAVARAGQHDVHGPREKLPPPPAAAGGVAQVVRTGRSELVPYPTDEARPGDGRQPNERSWLCVPLKVRDLVFGALAFVRETTEAHFDDDERVLAEEIGRRAAIAVENARLYRAAQEAVRKRDDFLAVASHELRTPLTSMDLYVSGLLRALGREQPGEVLAAAVARGLHKFDSQLGRLKELVEQLLDVARIDHGRLATTIADVDLVEVTREVVGRLEEESAQMSAPVSLTSPPTLVGRWDRSRVDQILTNLLANAMKYGRGKPVAVAIESDGATATIKVSDQGIGITPSEQERIFERFERAASVRNYGGLGLGLWIVRESVRAHGGRVRVESTPGAGSTFIVELPVMAAEERHDVAHDPRR